MKIAFVLPAIGKKHGELYVGTWKMEPLMIALLKAFTPQEIETEFYDDRIELIDYEVDADLIAITVETYTAKRAYAIAGEFRRRGKTVILGGYHVTLMPDEALDRSDSILIGNAETAWVDMLNDYRSGTLKKVYKGINRYTRTLPDRSAYKGKQYIPLKLVETGRGCPFNCTFCSISAYYCSRYIPRPVDDIVKEIAETSGSYYFFVDDNIGADPSHCRNLVERITDRGVKWTSQCSLNIAENVGLLKAMKKSGCDVLLIGFESLDKQNLLQMNKGWRTSLGNADDLVRRIHDEGISIYATFVFGFDHDTRETFRRVLEFSLHHRFFFAAFNHLLPFPGTQLYDHLREQGRLRNERWWLQPDYNYGDIPYIPKQMSPEELTEMCEETRKLFYSYSSIAKRFGGLVARNHNPALAGLFLAQNIRLKREVEGKMRIPLGNGLDEMPK